MAEKVKQAKGQHLSKGQRTHIRRMKQQNRQTGTVYKPQNQ